MDLRPTPGFFARDGSLELSRILNIFPRILASKMLSNSCAILTPGPQSFAGSASL